MRAAPCRMHQVQLRARDLMYDLVKRTQIQFQQQQQQKQQQDVNRRLARGGGGGGGGGGEDVDGSEADDEGDDVFDEGIDIGGVSGVCKAGGHGHGDGDDDDESFFHGQGSGSGSGCGSGCRAGGGYSHGHGHGHGHGHHRGLGGLKRHDTFSVGAVKTSVSAGAGTGTGMGMVDSGEEVAARVVEVTVTSPHHPLGIFFARLRCNGMVAVTSSTDPQVSESVSE